MIFRSSGAGKAGRHLVTVLGVSLCSSLALGAPTAAELVELPFEQLLTMQVVASTATRSDRQLIDTPAALTVITREDIRRAGATTVAEALRLVPGVQVNRISSSSWAVGIRGLGGLFSRMLLLMLNGHSVYNPNFGGTSWESLNNVIVDVERIEIIRRPGSSLWGMNTVNGVVNVITSRPRDVRALEVELAIGLTERHTTLRGAGSLGRQTTWRATYRHGVEDGFEAVALGRHEGSRDTDYLSGSLVWRGEADLIQVDMGWQSDQQRRFASPLFNGGAPTGMGPPEENSRGDGGSLMAAAT